MYMYIGIRANNAQKAITILTAKGQKLPESTKDQEVVTITSFDRISKAFYRHAEYHPPPTHHVQALYVFTSLLPTLYSSSSGTFEVHMHVGYTHEPTLHTYLKHNSNT